MFTVSCGEALGCTWIMSRGQNAVHLSVTFEEYNPHTVENHFYRFLQELSYSRDIAAALASEIEQQRSTVLEGGEHGPN